MATKTVFGVQADTDHLRALAVTAERLAAELADLPAALLTTETLASPPGVIAKRLRAVAALIDKREDGAELTGVDRAHIRMGRAIVAGLARRAALR